MSDVCWGRWGPAWRYTVHAVAGLELIAITLCCGPFALAVCMLHLLFLCITLLSTVATLVWSEMSTFSLCITDYADTSLGCTWGHPESLLSPLGLPHLGTQAFCWSLFFFFTL